MTSPLFAPIAALDLSGVCVRLMHPKAGLGWNESRTRAAEFAYREFLLVAKTFPAETPSPSADVDAFWHFHILDTVKYARDCAMAFGYFLHHKPDLSLAGKVPGGRDARTKTLEIMREALIAGGIARVDSHGGACNEAAYWTRVDASAEAAVYCTRVDASVEAAAYCTRVEANAEAAAYCTIVARDQQAVPANA